MTITIDHEKIFLFEKYKNLAYVSHKIGDAIAPFPSHLILFAIHFFRHNIFGSQLFQSFS